MIMQDKLEKERNDAKNNVEEYVYDMRDKLHGMLEKFVSESVSKMANRDLFFTRAYTITVTMYNNEFKYAVFIFSGSRCSVTEAGGH